MVDPLILKEVQVQAHLAELGRLLQRHLLFPSEVRLTADWGVSPLVAGLVGGGSETVARNVGRDTPVAPISDIDGAGLYAWIGMREEWESEKQAGRIRRFSFRSVSLTVHAGYRGNRFKPQLFRSEWSGFARWNGTELGHQSPGAGHPHWQIDLVESMERIAAHDANDHRAALRRQVGDVIPQDFPPGAMGRDDLTTKVGSLKLSRFHMASVAPWWTRGVDVHINSPREARDVELWVDKTVSYTIQELGRL